VVKGAAVGDDRTNHQTLRGGEDSTWPSRSLGAFAADGPSTQSIRVPLLSRNSTAMTCCVFEIFFGQESSRGGRAVASFVWANRRTAESAAVLARSALTCGTPDSTVRASRFAALTTRAFATSSSALVSFGTPRTQTPRARRAEVR